MDEPIERGTAANAQLVNEMVHVCVAVAELPNELFKLALDGQCR